MDFVNHAFKGVVIAKHLNYRDFSPNGKEVTKKITN
jgi:hypothetical protein